MTDTSYVKNVDSDLSITKKEFRQLPKLTTVTKPKSEENKNMAAATHVMGNHMGGEVRDPSLEKKMASHKDKQQEINYYKEKQQEINYYQELERKMNAHKDKQEQHYKDKQEQDYKDKQEQDYKDKQEQDYKDKQEQNYKDYNELQKKTAGHKDIHEQSYYKELERIKEELENEFNHNLRRECENEEQVSALQKEIECLKGVKYDMGDTWEERAAKIEVEFQRERSELDRYYKNEHDKFQRCLEEKNAMKLDAQKQEYDESIGKLKGEVQQTKARAMRKGQEATKHSVLTQNDLIKKLQDNFERDSKVVREQNSKLVEEIKILTSEKFDQSRQIRELHNKLERETKSSSDININMKKEFSTKMKCLLAENDKIKNKLKHLETDRDSTRKKLESCCRAAKDNVEKLASSERTIQQCEDTVASMRNENKNLSHEITLLRKEKTDLLHKIDQKLEVERALSLDKARLLTEIKEWCNKYVVKEKETLQNQKLVAKIRKEVDTHLNDFTQANDKLVAFENETNKLRQLYENERQENIRLHERFNQDAELIRQKEAENVKNRTMLNKIKSEFEGLKDKMEYDNAKIMQIESEKNSLESMVGKLKSAETDHLKQEIQAVHGKYVKEFAKRLDSVKTNYGNEIQQLKLEIKKLRRSNSKRVAVKETSVDEYHSLQMMDVDNGGQSEESFNISELDSGRRVSS